MLTLTTTMNDTPINSPPPQRPIKPSVLPLDQRPLATGGVVWGIGRVSPTVPLGGRTGGINYLYSTLLFRVTNLIPLHNF
jgi:hypothetical protein